MRVDAGKKTCFTCKGASVGLSFLAGRSGVLGISIAPSGPPKSYTTFWGHD